MNRLDSIRYRNYPRRYLNALVPCKSRNSWNSRDFFQYATHKNEIFRDTKIERQWKVLFNCHVLSTSWSYNIISRYFYAIELLYDIYTTHWFNRKAFLLFRILLFSSYYIPPTDASVKFDKTIKSWIKISTILDVPRASSLGLAHSRPTTATIYTLQPRVQPTSKRKTNSVTRIAQHFSRIFLQEIRKLGLPWALWLRSTARPRSAAFAWKLPKFVGKLGRPSRGCPSPLNRENRANNGTAN